MSQQDPTYLVVACEASADLHGAAVVRALRAREPGARFVGVGGAACAAAGVEIVGHARELGLLGLGDVLLALPRVWRIFRRTLQASRRPGIRAALLIDGPEFNLRLAPRLSHAGVPVVYFISPKLWASRPQRIEQIRRFVRRMLVIFPFEVGYYQQRGIAVEYVGNPVVQQLPSGLTRAAARAALGVGPEERMVAMLPGSRLGEITRIAPELGLAARLLQRDGPARVLVPCAPTVERARLIAALGADAPVQVLDGRSQEVLVAADAAVVAAGTATLEAALLDVPATIVYRVSWLSRWFYRMVLRTPFISLINILCEREVVREMWREPWSAQDVVREVHRLLAGSTRDEIRQGYAHIRRLLGQHDTAARVADALLQESRPPAPR